MDKLKEKMDLLEKNFKAAQERIKNDSILIEQLRGAYAVLEELAKETKEEEKETQSE